MQTKENKYVNTEAFVIATIFWRNGALPGAGVPIFFTMTESPVVFEIPKNLLYIWFCNHFPP